MRAAERQSSVGAADRSLWDGGVLSTGGNLVVRGDAAGYLNVYAADSGKLLKRHRCRHLDHGGADDLPRQRRAVRGGHGGLAAAG